MDRMAKIKLDQEAHLIEQCDKISETTERNWYFYTSNEKLIYVVRSFALLGLCVAFMYTFLLSLNFMTIGFTLISNETMKYESLMHTLFANPFTALALGIILTALFQNATATTSMIVSMVGAGIIANERSAIPMIMGSNLGTCISNSLISLTLSRDPAEFKRAITAATLNDGFNLLSILVFFPLELAFSLLERIASFLADVFVTSDSKQLLESTEKFVLLDDILNPITSLFIQLNETSVNEMANGNRNITEVSLKQCGEYWYLAKCPSFNRTMDLFNDTRYVMLNNDCFMNMTRSLTCTYWTMPMVKNLGDTKTGIIIIILSIIVLMICLFMVVKMLSLLIVGPIGTGVRKAINLSFGGSFRWFAKLILFKVSFVLTFFVQSSNIITGTLVPLSAVGMISLQRVYIMTLGSNIATTITAIISALTAPASTLKRSMRIALVHIMFNLLGVLIFLPFSCLRLPKMYSRRLGSIVTKHRWFLFVYVLGLFFLGPLAVFGLSLTPNSIGLYLVGIPILVIVLLVLIVGLAQKHASHILPDVLRNNEWLPEYMRSLEPYDSFLELVKTRIYNVFSSKKRSYYHSVPEPDFDDDDDDQKNNSLANGLRKYSVIESIIREQLKYRQEHNIRDDSSDDESYDGDDDDDENVCNPKNKHLEKSDSCRF